MHNKSDRAELTRLMLQIERDLLTHAHLRTPWTASGTAIATPQEEATINEQMVTNGIAPASSPGATSSISLQPSGYEGAAAHVLFLLPTGRSSDSGALSARAGALKLLPQSPAKAADLDPRGSLSVIAAPDQAVETLELAHN